jgi:hypothetical protein
VSLDLLPALRDSVIAAVGPSLQEWRGEPAVFTRRPVPDDAPTLIVIVNPPASISDADGLTSDRPIVQHDIAVYGDKGAAGSEQDQTRQVDVIAFALRDHFHRQKFSVQPSGFYAIDVQARGPIPAPVDDDQTVGRIVTLTIRLRRQ